KEIELNGDLRAMMEIDAAREGLDPKEVLKTLEVKKEADWKEHKILFYSYKKKDVKQYKTAAFKKDAKTNYWLPDPKFDSFSLREGGPELAKQMEKWRSTGEP